MACSCYLRKNSYLNPPSPSSSPVCSMQSSKPLNPQDRVTNFKGTALHLPSSVEFNFVQLHKRSLFFFFLHSHDDSINSYRSKAATEAGSLEATSDSNPFPHTYLVIFKRVLYVSLLILKKPILRNIFTLDHTGLEHAAFLNYPMLPFSGVLGSQ